MEKSWAYNLSGTLDIAVDRASSKSYITILPAEEKAKVQADVADIVKKGDKVWIDESQGIFEYPYQTLVVISQKK